MGFRLKVGEFATLMLVVAVVAEGFQLVVVEGNVQTRALGISAAILIAFVVGLRAGRWLYARERIRSVGWLPRTTAWHVDQDGVRHAIVTQNSGDIVSVAIPRHVAPEDVVAYVLIQLNDSRRQAGGS